MSETLSPDQIDFDRTYTLDEFLNLDFPDDGNKYELIEGKILTNSKTLSRHHSRIVARLATLLNNYAGETSKSRIGTVYTNCPVKLVQKAYTSDLVELDICFIVEEDNAQKEDGPISAVPDLVAEVWAGKDTLGEIHAKIEACRQANVPLIWSIYIEGDYVMIYKRDQEYPNLINLSEVLEGDPILPGFRVSVEALLK